MNLVKRVISGLVIITITLAVMWYNNPFFLLFLVLMGTLMAWEWEQMLTKRTTILSVIMAAVSAVTVFLTFSSYFVLVLLLVAVSFFGFFFRLRKTTKDIAGLFSFGVLYINIPLFSLTAISSFYEISEFHENASFLILLWLFVTVWASDIGGYVFGHLLKGLYDEDAHIGRLGGDEFAVYIEREKTEDARDELKKEISYTDNPADKQALLAQTWQDCSDNPDKEFIKDGIMELERRMKEFEKSGEK